MSDPIAKGGVEAVEVERVEETSYQFNAREKFTSFESKFECHKNAIFVELWKRDSRTLAGARKRGIKKPIKPELRYYEVKYHCILGGERLMPKEKGKDALHK